MTTFEGFAIRPTGFDDLPASWNSSDLEVCRTREMADGGRNWPRRKGDPVAVRVTLPEGAYFSVAGDTDMSEGRGGQYEVARHVDLWAAYDASRGKGAQGSSGYVTIMVPYQQEFTVTGTDGYDVVLSTSTAYRRGSLDNLIVGV
ncbi:hypothetical protein [Arthrobacter sp. MDT1-65]